MPPKRNNVRNLSVYRRRTQVPAAPPPTMTWGKASVVLVLGVVFDALGAFFALFWLLGPVFAGLICTGVGLATVGSLWGLTAYACATSAGFAGFAFSPALTAFGSVMAMLVGFAAWGTVGVILALTNGRIFKENFTQMLWLLGGLALDQIPIVNAIPALTPILWRLYRAQIKKEKAALAEYKAKKEVLDTQERQEQFTRALQQMRAAQDAQREQKEAAAQEQEYKQEEPVVGIPRLMDRARVAA